jgi:ATP-dependent DNA ligase
MLDVQGISDFDALHSNRHNDEAQLYAFDLVAIDNDDLRGMPLFARKAGLGKLLKGPPRGHLRRTVRAGRDRARTVRAACRMGLEGLVSKHRERRYRPRTCGWVKVKNREHPAFSRVMDQFG